MHTQGRLRAPLSVRPRKSIPLRAHRRLSTPGGSLWTARGTYSLFFNGLPHYSMKRRGPSIRESHILTEIQMEYNPRPRLLRLFPPNRRGLAKNASPSGPAFNPRSDHTIQNTRRTVACKAATCCMRMSTTAFGTISSATLLTALPQGFLHL